SRLYEDLGMPGASDVKSVKLNIFAHLCLEFQQKLQVAKTQETQDALEKEKVNDDDNRNLHIDQQIEIVKDDAERKAKPQAMKAYKEYKEFEQS
ncbi:MAG TPA: hypothetical protein VK635_31080, partial [Bradyrhizobium sp.]|nr:hypothetical protein [Bradyrhizobium sp.]